ncbi:MAG: ECF-type sigma factor [Lysobacterales bacterium]
MERPGGQTPFTVLLRQWSSGDEAARDALMARAYQELKRIARAQMAGERAGHTLQPTALVHEAYLKLAGGAHIDWQDRTHFFAVSARVIRQVLVDSARRRQAARRDASGMAPLTLSVTEDVVDLQALDQALNRLEALDPTQARVVELRYFAGLSIAETAHSMDLSTATVERAWRAARAWLYGQLGAV